MRTIRVCIAVLIVILLLPIAWKVVCQINMRELTRSESVDGKYVCTVINNHTVFGENVVVTLSTRRWWAEELGREERVQSDTVLYSAYHVEWDVVEGKTMAVIVTCLNPGDKPTEPSRTVRLAVKRS